MFRSYAWSSETKVKLRTIPEIINHLLTITLQKGFIHNCDKSSLGQKVKTTKQKIKKFFAKAGNQTRDLVHSRWM